MLSVRLLNTEFIKNEFFYVFKNEFNERTIVGEFPNELSSGRKILFTKDKNGVREAIAFGEYEKMVYGRTMSIGYYYSSLNQRTYNDLYKTFLNYKINNKYV